LDWYTAEVKLSSLFVVIYSCVFYEGQHDDARTNLAIALTAEREGCDLLNYCEVVDFIKDNHSHNTNGNGKPAANGKSNPKPSEPSGKVVGVVLKDKLTGEQFQVYSKSILLCGGPFTDSVRKLAYKHTDREYQRAVMGASGVHIVLPGYFAPSGIGLVDMSTSDGRFLFFLPWEGHVLVGTTDTKLDDMDSVKQTAGDNTTGTATTNTGSQQQQATKEDKINAFISRPEPSEREIQWILHEAAKYLSPEMQLRREDVLSAWAGVRPLALNIQHTAPNASAGAPAATATASRDHVISHDPVTNIVHVAGGKWTTYREM
jgi:glycerol-3-phosphate dehydrogenase